MTRAYSLAVPFIFAAALSLATSSAHAQPNPGGGGGGVNVSAGPSGGIKVDAEGVIALLEMPEDATTLLRQRAKAMKADPAARKVDKASPLRMISLTRLEKAVAAKIAKGEKIDDEMENLAGLVRVQYVFLFPDTKDIVIAGPAEGVLTDPTGRQIGADTGRAVVKLEDLVVALRAFAPGQKGASVIGCSIDPTKEGLAKLQAALKKRPNPAQANQYADYLEEALGLQNVTVNGISPKTHAAKVLVEADYKMKLLGIGADRKPSPKLKSYVDVANPAAVSRNALKRWWFVPNYECIRVAADDMAMELVGDGVKLVGEDEVVAADGSRTQTGGADKASQTFTDSFTKAYPEIARRAAVYGQLRNIIDLSVAAAFMQKKDYFKQADWNMSLFSNEKEFSVETHNAPKQVPTACIAISKGNRVSFPIGGGVTIQPKQALASDNLLSDEDGNVKKQRENIDLAKLAENQWWWD